MPLMMNIIILFLLLLFTGAKTLAPNNSTDNTYKYCPPKRCSNKGPEIRFPFRLKTQPKSCGLEGFELSCLNNNKTLLHLPFSGDDYYYVQEISYLESSITIWGVDDTPCPFQNFLSFNLTNSRFYFVSPTNFSLLNCTSDDKTVQLRFYESGPIDCISHGNTLVYAVAANGSMERLPSSCRAWKTVEIPGEFNVSDFVTRPVVLLGWESPDRCLHCENSGNYCGFNITSNSTICLKQKNGGFILVTDGGFILVTDVGFPLSKILMWIGIIIGLTILFAWVMFRIYKSRKSGKEKETQLKIEKFLEDYRTVNPTRYSYKELKKITNKFKHRLGQGGYGIVFKGKLFNGIPVAVKMLEHLKENNGQEFINEVATIGRIHHFHIVPILGFCYEGTRRALIYEFMPNGSLEKVIFSKMSKDSTRCQLNWEKLRMIAIGVARGVEYLHQGCNQRILHFDIKPHNILLDHNFQPKISDFGLAKLCSKDISIVTMTAARGTAGYIAPELFSRNFGEVSYKSDVYSYGMMLLEMVGCRKNTDPTVENQSQIYFPQWIYNKMRHGQELSLEFEEDGDEGIAKKLATVALWCIQWNPTERPTMPMVLQMLEGDLQCLEMPPMPFVSSNVEMGAII